MTRTGAGRWRNAAQSRRVSGAAATTIDVAGDGFAVKTGDIAHDAAAWPLATVPPRATAGWWRWATSLKPCPSLFSFRVKSPVLEGLAGSVPDARVELKARRNRHTRWAPAGDAPRLSGPALRLSGQARGCRTAATRARSWPICCPTCRPRAVRSTLDATRRSMRARPSPARRGPSHNPEAVGAPGPRERPRGGRWGGPPPVWKLTSDLVDLHAIEQMNLISTQVRASSTRQGRCVCPRVAF